MNLKERLVGNCGKIEKYLISDSLAKICSAKTTTDFTIALLFV